MVGKNIISVLGEHEDGALVYNVMISGKNRLAKFVGMSLWLMVKGSNIYTGFWS